MDIDRLIDSALNGEGDSEQSPHSYYIRITDTDGNTVFEGPAYKFLLFLFETPYDQVKMRGGGINPYELIGLLRWGQKVTEISLLEDTADNSTWVEEEGDEEEV